MKATEEQKELKRGRNAYIFFAKDMREQIKALELLEDSYPR